MDFLRGFYYAGRGIASAFSERNFRFHLCTAAFVIFFAAKFYSFSAAEWAVLFLTCGGVIALELVNTALERLADSVSKENDPLIRIAKDCAAGAVLIAAASAVAVGIILFWRKDVLGLILLFFSEPLRLAALILSVALAWCVVFLPKSRRDKEKEQ